MSSAHTGAGEEHFHQTYLSTHHFIIQNDHAYRCKANKAEKHPPKSTR